MLTNTFIPFQDVCMHLYIFFYFSSSKREFTQRFINKCVILITTPSDYISLHTWCNALYFSWKKLRTCSHCYLLLLQSWIGRDITFFFCNRFKRFITWKINLLFCLLSCAIDFICVIGNNDYGFVLVQSLIFTCLSCCLLHDKHTSLDLLRCCLNSLFLYFCLLHGRLVQAWSPLQWMMTFAYLNMRQPTPLLVRAPYLCVLVMNQWLLTSHWSLPMRTSRRDCETQREKIPYWGEESSSWRIRYKCKQWGNAARRR